MQAHRIEATIGQDHKLTLENLPFRSGEHVEVIILARSHQSLEQNRYPLRGTVIQYLEPTEPIAQDDWDIAQ
jgi:hypothetical protein